MVYHTAQVSLTALRGVSLTALRGVSLTALRGVNLSACRDKMVAVMGPSGCGKPTLLNCLLGLDTADKGQITTESVSLPEMRHGLKEDQHARMVQEP